MLPTCSICAACKWVPESTKLGLLCVTLGVQLSVPALPGAQPEGCDAAVLQHALPRVCGVVWCPWAPAWPGTLPSPRVAIGGSFTLPASPGSPLVLFSVVPSVVQRMQAPLGDWQLPRSYHLSDTIHLIGKENKPLRSGGGCRELPGGICLNEHLKRRHRFLEYNCLGKASPWHHGISEKYFGNAEGGQMRAGPWELFVCLWSNRAPTRCSGAARLPLPLCSLTCWCRGYSCLQAAKHHTPFFLIKRLLKTAQCGVH